MARYNVYREDRSYVGTYVAASSFEARRKVAG